MRFAWLAALAALWMTPAQAVTSVSFEVSALIPTTHRLDYGIDPSFWPSSCSGLPVCPSETFSSTDIFFASSIFGSSTDGVTFTFSQTVLNSGTFAQVSGIAKYLGDGAYLGTLLNYATVPHCTIHTPVCETVSGSIASFSIRQTNPAPVPEPATWALMLLGFGAIGWAMRRHVKPTAPIMVQPPHVTFGVMPPTWASA